MNFKQGGTLVGLPVRNTWPGSSKNDQGPSSVQISMHTYAIGLDSQILRFSDSQTLRFSDCQIERFSDSQIHRPSDSQSVRLRDSQILSFSDPQILRLSE